MSNSKPSLRLKPALFKFLGFYLSNLAMNPIRTKAVTSAIISASGDLFAQKAVQQQQWQPYRTFKFAAYGAMLSVIIHHWLQILDRVFKNRKSKWDTLLRVAVDQVVFQPIINIFFFTVMALLDGRPDTIGDRISKNLLPQLKNGWRVWPVVQYVNFTYIPPIFRVLFGNLAAFFWNIYLSIRNNRRV